MMVTLSTCWPTGFLMRGTAQPSSAPTPAGSTSWTDGGNGNSASPGVDLKRAPYLARPRPTTARGFSDHRPAAEDLREAADELAVAGQLPRFLLMYKFAIEELMTKLRILSEEFDFVHRHDPIEHITSRVKRPEAIKEKVRRRGLDRSSGFRGRRAR